MKSRSQLGDFLHFISPKSSYFSVISCPDAFSVYGELWMFHCVLVYTTKSEEARKNHQGAEAGVQGSNTEELTYKSEKELGFIQHSAVRLLLSLDHCRLLSIICPDCTFCTIEELYFLNVMKTLHTCNRAVCCYFSFQLHSASATLWVK